MSKISRESAQKQILPSLFSLEICSLDLELLKSIGQIINPNQPELIKNYLYVAEGEKKIKQKTRKKSKIKPEEEKYILCMQCKNKISQHIYKMNHQGAFDHTFLNPAGDVFRIGCFQKADGCVVIGEASLEWTWFQGCQWQVALCGHCLKHLGWYYQSETISPFFGLILDALI